MPLAALDLVTVVIAYLVPLVVRLEGAVSTDYWQRFWRFAPIAVGIHLAVNLLFGLYGEMWRYASVEEARRLVASAAAAGGFVIAADLVLGTPMPRSVVVFGALLVLIGQGAVRFQSRLFGFRRRTAGGTPTRVLIVGAGSAGAQILRDIQRNASLNMEPVAIVDDDRRKIGRSMHEVRVIGPRSTIPELVARLHVDQVLLAIPSATGDVVRDVAALCEAADVPVRLLPSVHEIVGGRPLVADFRDLQIEDLLGRQQVETDLAAVGAMLRDRRVLITGAGGSIGSEIVRQVATFEPASVILLDHDETHLHDALTKLDPRVPAVSVLADIRDPARVQSVFMHHRPHVVFHAAAHKHVPILEVHADEAVLTNVIGTANVADSAVAAGVERFVLISTDKAVKPSSVMGASKWFAEEIVRSLQDNGSVYCAVRFGNVIGSRGSVIPTFFDQIERGGPVTVTDIRMRRFFMSVREAVQLVLQSAALARGGELFTLEMGEPVNIYGLARRVIRLSGRVPERDIEIRLIGPRPGEKLVEEVLNEQEEPIPTIHPGIMVSRPRIPDRAALRRRLQELEVLANTGMVEDLAKRIKELAQTPIFVPEAATTETEAVG